MEYGVAVSNKFDLSALGDEDPYEILERTVAKKKDEKTKEKSSKSASKSAKSQKKVQVTTQEQQKNRQNESMSFKQDGENRPPRREQSGKQDRGGKSRDQNRDRDHDDNRRERRPRDENVAPQSDFRSDRPERFGDGERGRGRGRGFGRGRGGRGRGGREGFDRFGKREFDRHSGNDKTGVKPVDKKGGGGSHNWGTDKDEIEGQLNDSVEEPHDWSTNQGDENQDPNESNENNDVDGETNEKLDDEPKEMTLDEYKASKAKDKVKPAFNIRRANEGSDQRQWKNTFIIKKKEVSESEEESEEEEELEYRHQTKLAVDIPIQFNDNPRRGGGRGRGGRGGRGEGRGRGGRGGRGGFGDRGSRNNGPREVVPNYNDEHDFPSLVQPS